MQKVWSRLEKIFITDTIVYTYSIYYYIASRKGKRQQTFYDGLGSLEMLVLIHQIFCLLLHTTLCPDFLKNILPTMNVFFDGAGTTVAFYSNRNEDMCRMPHTYLVL